MATRPAASVRSHGRKKLTLASTREPKVLRCPACYETQWKPASRVRGVRLSRCIQCGLLGTTHFVTREKTPDGLYDVGAEDLRIYRQQYLPQRICTYARFLPQLEPFREGGRLLEIGAGYGYFLKLASDAGWDSEGVEISPYCCEIARQQGCKIRQCALDNCDFSKAGYDAIVLWDVIEHFTQPDEVIARCWELLRSGGALMMRTPDARALTPGWQPLRASYRHFAYPANTAEHVFHFTPDDLSAVVANHGLKVSALDCTTHWDERVISANHPAVRVARRLLMRAAQRANWPYEFVLTAVKA